MNVLTRGGDDMNDIKKRGLASASEATKQLVARRGGQARAGQLGHKGYQSLGYKGGKAAQLSGKAHKLTDAERSRGGQIGGSK